VDLSPLKRADEITVDKHSTGGVGDKTTLAVVPIVAACGVPIAKMSGRGLGHTGGTVDKLEAIPGFRTKLSGSEFMEIVKKHGLCIAGQSANLAPADKKLYALRDVTATVDSIPLIAASIMSKKIAAGADAILLDVKTGSGAFMKNLNDARELARTMVEIGNSCGRNTAAIITDMSAPLGCEIGNSLELREVVQILKGETAPLLKNLTDLCVELAANMLFLAKKGTPEECQRAAKESITSGKALQKLKDMIQAQGGDPSYIEEICQAAHTATINSPQEGYISEFDTEGTGIAAMLLGAGRERPEDEIAHKAGITLKITQGSYVQKNQPLATIHTENKNTIPKATEKFLSALTFSKSPPKKTPLIHEKIGM
jgi:pyrimidine-nucleoside phosphorylase